MIYAYNLREWGNILVSCMDISINGKYKFQKIKQNEYETDNA